MFTRGIALAIGCGLLAPGCAEQPDETREIIDNLIQAGFPADDIIIAGGIVYVGRDAEVSLAASREMLQTGDSRKEQYRTTNLVDISLAKICINGSTFTGVFSTALDLAIQNYQEQPLTFAMARTPSTGCSFTINAVIQPGLVGGVSGFPSGGLPFGTINIGDGLSTFSVDTIEHVITHEIGHTIGFRHSDFFNRSISCGTGGNEGDAGVGAILIPGTPSGATVGGSIMNSCFRTVETGEFTDSDLVALRAMYVTDQSIIIDVNSTPGWDIIVPMNINNDGLTDLLTYNKTTGLAVYSVANPNGGQNIVRQVSASPGWTSLVPLDINNDGLTDLLSYNANTGRAVYSVATGTSGDQSIIIDVNSTPGWDIIAPMNLDHDGLTDLLTYNKTTGLAVYSVANPNGGQTVARQVSASPGWTSLVPLAINNDDLTDLLSYNAATGRAVYSVGARD
jgi:hypothetical protein